MNLEKKFVKSARMYINKFSRNFGLAAEKEGNLD